MSVRKGAFAASAKGGFIPSRKWARGWPSLVYVIARNNGTIYAINPATGAVAWTVTTDRYARITIDAAKRLHHRQSASVRRIGNAAVTATSLTLSTVGNGDATLAALGQRVLTVDTVTGAPHIVLLNDDMSAHVWAYPFEHGTADALTSPSVDSAGNSYWRNAVTLDNAFPVSAADANLYALDAGGNQLWKRNYGTDFSQPVSELFRTAIAPDALYVHCLISTGGFPATINYHLLKVSKVDGSIIDSLVTRFASGNISTTARILWHPGGWVFMADDTGGGPFEIIRYDTATMSETAAFVTGTGSGLATSLALAPDGSGDILAVGFRSTTWTGSGGSPANLYRLDSDLNLIWAKDLTGGPVDLYDVAAGYLPV